jgi:hypothetical protein
VIYLPNKADSYATVETGNSIDSAKGVLEEGRDTPLRKAEIRLRRGPSGGRQKLFGVGKTKRTATSVLEDILN